MGIPTADTLEEVLAVALELLVELEAATALGWP
jgi:hypothetical protein